MKLFLSTILFSLSAICTAWETSDCSTELKKDEIALLSLAKAAEEYTLKYELLPDLSDGIPEELLKKIPPSISHYLILGSSYSDNIGFTCGIKQVEFNNGNIQEQHYRSCDYTFSSRIGACENKVLRIELNDS